MFICNYISKTQFFDKLRRENLMEESLEILNYNFSLNLELQFLKKDEILFKINDYGDKFYVILSGNLAILKPSSEKRLISNKEYLEFLHKLNNEKEEFLLMKTMYDNKDKIEIQSLKDLILCDIIIFKNNINQDDILAMINKPSFSLREFNEIFHEKTITSKDLNFDMEFIYEFVQLKNEFISNKSKAEMKNNKAYGNKNRGGEDKFKKYYNYIMKKLSLTQEETIFYEKFKDFFILLENKQEYLLAYYEHFLSLNEGKFFGDLSLDKPDKKRNATIKALEESILGFIPNETYQHHLIQEKNKLRMKEVLFLQQNFFFRTIKVNSFDKKYFDNFVALDFRRGFTLANEGQENECIYFIREGVFEIYIEANIVELNNLLKKIINKNIGIINHKNSESKKCNTNNNNSNNISYLEMLLKKFTLEFNLRLKSENYIKSIYKKRIFNVTLLSTNDLIGVEAILLEINSFYKAVVHSEKAHVYKIDVNIFNAMMNSEFYSKEDFFEFTQKRIMSFLERASTVLNCFHDKINYSLIQDTKYLKRRQKDFKDSNIDYHSQENKNIKNMKNDEINSSNSFDSYEENSRFVKKRLETNSHKIVTENNINKSEGNLLANFISPKNNSEKEKNFMSKTVLPNLNSKTKINNLGSNFNQLTNILSTTQSISVKNKFFNKNENSQKEDLETKEKRNANEASRNIIINYQKFKVNSDKKKLKNSKKLINENLKNEKLFYSQAEIFIKDKKRLNYAKESDINVEENKGDVTNYEIKTQNAENFPFSKKIENSPLNNISSNHIQNAYQTEKKCKNLRNYSLRYDEEEEDEEYNRNYINKRKTLYDNYNNYLNQSNKKLKTLIVEDFLKQDSYISNNRIDLDNELFGIANNTYRRYSKKFNFAAGNINTIIFPNLMSEKTNILSVYRNNSSIQNEKSKKNLELIPFKTPLKSEGLDKSLSKGFDEFLKETQIIKQNHLKSNEDLFKENSNLIKFNENLNLDFNKISSNPLKSEECFSLIKNEILIKLTPNKIGNFTNLHLNNEYNYNFKNNINEENYINNLSHKSFDKSFLKTNRETNDSQKNLLKIEKNNRFQNINIIAPIINSNENKEILGFGSTRKKDKVVVLQKKVDNSNAESKTIQSHILTSKVNVIEDNKKTKNINKISKKEENINENKDKKNEENLRQFLTKEKENNNWIFKKPFKLDKIQELKSPIKTNTDTNIPKLDINSNRNIEEKNIKFIRSIDVTTSPFKKKETNFDFKRIKKESNTKSIEGKNTIDFIKSKSTFIVNKIRNKDSEKEFIKTQFKDNLNDIDSKGNNRNNNIKDYFGENQKKKDKRTFKNFFKLNKEFNNTGDNGCITSFNSNQGNSTRSTFEKFETLLAKNTMRNEQSQISLMNFGLNENDNYNSNDFTDNMRNSMAKKLNSIAIIKKKREFYENYKTTLRSKKLTHKNPFPFLCVENNNENKTEDNCEENFLLYDQNINIKNEKDENIFTLNEFSANQVFKDKTNLMVKEEIVDAVKKFFKERNSKGIINYLSKKNSYIVKVKNCDQKVYID